MCLSRLEDGWPILFFDEVGCCLNDDLGDFGGSGAGICPSRVWKVPKEAARAPNDRCLL